MIAWLATVGEQLPIDSGDSRLMRTGTLARFLVGGGHSVVWWTSTFNHVHKHHRFQTDKEVVIDSRLSIHLLHGTGYSHHVSLRRALDHAIVAAKFAKISRTRPRPDLIVASLPTLELAAACCAFGRRNGIPVILDVRDLWPDAFVEVLPKTLRPFAAPAVFGFRHLARFCCRNAQAIIGPAERYVEWGINHAGRGRTTWDRQFPFAYPSIKPSSEAILEAEKFWNVLGISRTQGEFYICFFGLLGRQFALDTVIESARILRDSYPRIRLILCGDGDHSGFYKTLAKNCNNVIFPGWVGAAQIWSLMRMSAIGVAPYRPNALFNDHLPNKPIEYLSANLPVLASVHGALGSLLEGHDCGVVYDSGSAHDLARTIAGLHDNPDRLNIMAANAGHVYNQYFVAEQIYPEMVRFMEMINTSQPPVPLRS
jgi:glycosyltransferase involved in cell wall biosynthesis